MPQKTKKKAKKASPKATVNRQRRWVDTISDVDETPYLIADGLDDAILGLVEFWGRMGRTQAVLYDRDKVIDILVKRDGMTHEDAEEFYQFNIVDAYVGDHTPAYAVLAPGVIRSNRRR